MDAILMFLFSLCFIGWDDTPRFPAKGMRDVVHFHNTPVSFATLLPKQKVLMPTRTAKLITINAWNEWVEGSYRSPTCSTDSDI